ncbi:MAG TPA: hypothetical protein VIC84_06025 [Blastocatellia bacterium]
MACLSLADERLKARIDPFASEGPGAGILGTELAVAAVARAAWFEDKPHFSDRAELHDKGRYSVGRALVTQKSLAEAPCRSPLQKSLAEVMDKWLKW